MLILVLCYSMVTKIFSWKLDNRERILVPVSGITVDYNASTSSKLVDDILKTAHISNHCAFDGYYYIDVYPNESLKTKEEVCKAVAKGVTILIGPRDAYDGKIIDVISIELGLLHINLYQEELGEDPMRSNFSLSIFPSFDQKLMLNHLVLLSWEWNYFLLLYHENHTPLKLLPAFMKSYSPPALLKIKDTSDEGLLKAALDMRQICDLRICWRAINKVVVDLKPKHTLGLLNAALKLGMINIHNWFLLLSLDDLTKSFEQFTHNNMRISLTSAYDGTFDTSEKELKPAKTLLKTWVELKPDDLTSFKDFALLYDGILLACQLGNSAPRPNRCGTVKSYNVPRQTIKTFNGLMGPVQFDSGGKRSSSVIQLWELGFRGQAFITGKWSTDESGNKQLNMNSRTVEGTHDHYVNQMRIQNLLRVTTIEEAPYIIKKVLPNGKIAYEGFCIDLISRLAFSLKFQYQINIVKDGRYGEKLSNNKDWDGMVGEILRGEADMGVAPMTVTAGRLEVIDFTDPFLQLGISMLMRQPKPASTASLTSFLWPLSASVWTFSAISTVMTTLLVVLVTALSPNETINEFNLSNSLWYLICILLRAGSGYNCQSMAARFVSAVWWSFTLVLISQYTANFAAVLTVDRKSMPFNSFEELANQTEYSFGAMQRGSTLSFFKNSRIDIFQQLYHRMISKEPSALVLSNKDGVKRALEEKYVYLMESATLEYQVTKNCNLTRVGNVVLGSNGYSIALPKGSKWREKLTRQILDMHEKGIIMEMKETWWQKSQESCETTENNSSSLGSAHVQGLFALLAFGLLIGIFVSIIEKALILFRAKPLSSMLRIK